MFDVDIFSTFIFMKRNIVKFLLLAMVALFIYGCGDDSSVRVIMVIEPIESSSSIKKVSSSSIDYFARSSSSKTNSSSSRDFVLETGEFVKIGNQEWMTKNLNTPVEGRR